MNIAVAGTGYVGLSLAMLLSQHHHVLAVDMGSEKVKPINGRKSPIQDEYIEKYLAEKELGLTATWDGEGAYKQADFLIIATPTNYDPQKNFFDTLHRACPSLGKSQPSPARRSSSGFRAPSSAAYISCPRGLPS